jgi:DNA invertase Pin-like site-specific DNA recombinase
MQNPPGAPAGFLIERMPQQQLNAAMYLRVSTDKQDHAMQATELREFAGRMGWTLHEYADKISGTKARRPGLDRLMQDARMKKIDIVMVWKLDRFGRTLRDLVDNILQLDTWGVRFLAVTQSIDTDQKNPTSRLLLHILAAVAEFERELIVGRVKAGRKQYETDYAAGRVGKETQSRSGKNLAPHRPQKIFRRDRAAEMKAAGMSLRAIARELGVPHTTVADALRSR